MPGLEHDITARRRGGAPRLGAMLRRVAHAARLPAHASRR